MLGKAVLFAGEGARLISAIQAGGDRAGAVRIRDWLLWHRRKRAFSRADLECCKRESRVRQLWFVLSRGVDRAWTQEQLGVQPRLATLPAKPARISQELREEGLVAGAVGRIPLHIEGELPPAGHRKGRITKEVWVQPMLAAWSEAEITQALAARRRQYVWGEAGFRGSELQLLATDLRRVGGFKVMPASRLGWLLLQIKMGPRGLPSSHSLGAMGMTTLTASHGQAIVMLSFDQEGRVVAAKLDAAGWALLMGINGETNCPMARGLAAVSDSAGRAIMGQAVHFQVAVQLLTQVLRRLDTSLGGGQRVVRYASLFSGIDVVAAALMQLCGERLRFELAAEANRTVFRALKAAWGTKILKYGTNALGKEVTERLGGPLKGKLDVLMLSLRCAPWSAANTSPIASADRQCQLERALEECQALLALVEANGPRAVVVECVAGMLRKCLKAHWTRLMGMFAGLKEWRWSRQAICPRATLGGWIPRRRVWIIGIRKAQALGSGL